MVAALLAVGDDADAGVLEGDEEASLRSVTVERTLNRANPHG
jgi:hypothetical protein